MAERVPRHGLASRFELGHDIMHARTFREKNIDAVVRVHDSFESSGFGVDVDAHLGDVDGVEALPLLRQVQSRQ